MNQTYNMSAFTKRNQKKYLTFSFYLVIFLIFSSLIIKMEMLFIIFIYHTKTTTATNKFNDLYVHVDVLYINYKSVQKICCFCINYNCIHVYVLIHTMYMRMRIKYQLMNFFCLLLFQRYFSSSPSVCQCYFLIKNLKESIMTKIPQ